MTTYYHSASVLLRPGSVIEPGNYGRMLGTYRNDNGPNGWKLATELALETRRARDFSALPSRLSCCFAFLDVASALATRDRLGGLTNILYEVELADDDASSHIGDFDLISRCYIPRPDLAFLQTIEDVGTTYWRGKPGGTRELLTNSGLRVVRQVNWGAPSGLAA